MKYIQWTIMDGDNFDLIVIGGSANGSQAAYIAAKNKLNVAIIEEHDFIGLPEHCSGLFSYSGLNQLNSMPPDDIIFNKNIYGANIVSPNGKIFSVRKSDPHAIVCDRAAFDKFLLNRAKDEGAKVYQPYKAMKAKRSNNMIYLDIRSKKGDTISLSSPLVISGEGIRGSIANQLGLTPPPKNKFVNAAQFYMEDLNEVNQEMVEVYQTQKYAPDFFAWIIPMTNTTAKIGLGTSRKSAAKELEMVIKEHEILKNRCKGSDITRVTAGRIPITGPIKKTYADNLMLVGDVAGQTKPTTGGGVVLGGLAGQIAGQIAVQCKLKNRYDSNFLKIYQKKWKKEMYSNLKRMLLVRNYMNNLSDFDVNILFNKLENKGIIQDIENLGHIDNQGVIVKKFMRTLSLYPFYFRTSFKLLKSFF